MTLSSQPFYAPGPFYAAGTATSVANLPNRSGSNTTKLGLQAGDIYQVGAVFYRCETPTSGSAIWYLLPAQPRDPFGRELVQTDATATVTVQPGIQRLVLTYAGAVTVTFPTVLAGAPIDTSFLITKQTTNAGAITLTPDAGAAINGAAADATMTMPGSTTASSTTTSDITVRVRRSAALDWRVCVA